VSASTFGSSSSLLSLCRALDNAESSSSSTDFMHPQAAARTSMKKSGHGFSQYMGPSQHSVSAAHNNSIRNNAIWPTLESNHMENNCSNPYALASLDVSNSINQLQQLQALASFDVNKSINQLQQLQQQLMNFSAIQNILSATATTYGAPTLLASDSHPLYSSSLPLDPLVLPLNPSNVPNIYPSNTPHLSSAYASQQTAAFLRSLALQANRPNVNVPFHQNPLVASSANGPLDYMDFFHNAESGLYNLSSSQPLQLDLTNRNTNNNQDILETSNIASPTSLMRLLSDRRLPSAPQQLDAIPPEFWLLNGSNEEVATTLTRLRNGLERSDSSSEEDNIDSGSTPEPIPRFKPNSETDRKWMERYVELCQYKEQNGDCLVPDGYANNPPLARWVREQRGQYKRAMAGKSSYMSKQRLEALQKLDFTWSLRDKVEWKLRYEELLLFKSQHGHCLVPSHYEQNVKLGTWVANQRKHYRLYQEGKQNMMTQNRIDMLNEVGFKWSLRVTRKRKSTAS
jgi:hypothetical protein